MEPTQNPVEPTPEMWTKKPGQESSKTAVKSTDTKAKPDTKKQEEKTSRSKLLAQLNSRFQAPSWLFSALFHGVAFALLALLTITNPIMDPVLEVEFYAADEISESLVEVEFEMDSLLDESMESDLLSEMPVPDMSEMTEALQSQIESPNSSEVSYEAPSEFSKLYGSESNAMTEVGGGMGEVSGKFLGTPVRGRMTVIFDITASMFHSVSLVLKALDNPQFADAQVYAVFGGSFKYPKQELYVVPYLENSNLHHVEVVNSKGQKRKRDKIYKQLISRKNTLSLEIPKKKKSRQSLGAAIDAIIRESKVPNTIFVFSDFEDGVDIQYMQELLPIIKRKRISIVFYHPKKFKKDRNTYLEFAKATKGQLKENLVP